MPPSRDVAVNYRDMKKNHPDWSRERLQAASLSMAHEAGNPDVKPRKKAAAEDWLINWDEAVVDQFPWEEWVGDGEESDPVAEAKESFIKKWGDDIKRAMTAALFDTPGLPPTPSERSALFAKSKSLPDGSRVLATKDSDGRPRLTFWVSNNFRDSDHPPEILSAAAHQSFVSWAEKNSYHPEAWLWHTPGTRWGQVDWMDYFDGFLVESVLADKGMEQVAERLAADPDIRVSHGYVIPVGGRDKDDFSVIQSYYQYEISPLKSGSEANPFTGSIPLDLTPLLTGVNTSDQQPTTEPYSASPLGDITMPMDPTKRKWLEDKLGPERVKALEAATLDLGSVAKGLGLETKDLTAALVGEGAVEPEAAVQKTDPEPVTTVPITMDAEALSVAVKAAVGSEFNSLQSFLTAMKADINLLKAGHNKAVADAIRPPAGDSVQYLWGKRPTDDPNNVITKEASDALGGPRDDSDNLPPHMKDLTNLIPALSRGNGHSGPGDALSH